MQFSRYINLSFALAGLIAWVLMTKTSVAVMASMEVTDNALIGDMFRISTVVGLALGAGLTIYAYSRQDVQTWTSEVAVELSKVTWPDWEETKKNTMIVIIFAIVLSAILSSFDFFWKWLTDLILLQG